MDNIEAWRSMEGRMSTVEQKVKSLEHEVFDNGSPGLSSVVQKLNEQFCSFVSAHAATETERQRADSKRMTLLAVLLSFLLVLVSFLTYLETTAHIRDHTLSIPFISTSTGPSMASEQLTDGR